MKIVIAGIVIAVLIVVYALCKSSGTKEDVDQKAIEYLIIQADGHDDPRGEDGADGLESAILHAKTEVAREIFEDIKARSIYDFPSMYYKISRMALDELEKKYTE